VDYIVIDNVAPYEGRWEFDLDNRELTTREWGWIKRLAGYLPLTIEEGLADPELVVVFACIALRRAGKVEVREVPAVFEQLSDAPFGSSVTMETDVKEEEAEGDAGPPPSSSTGNDATSGDGSKTSSETSGTTRNLSGTLDSAISVSDHPTLVISPRGS
jgi:hypothetical protein